MKLYKIKYPNKRPEEIEAIDLVKKVVCERYGETRIVDVERLTGSLPGYRTVYNLIYRSTAEAEWVPLCWTEVLVPNPESGFEDGFEDSLQKAERRMWHFLAKNMLKPEEKLKYFEYKECSFEELCGDRQQQSFN